MTSRRPRRIFRILSRASTAAAMRTWRSASTWGSRPRRASTATRPWTTHLVGDGAVETFLERIAPHCLGREAQVEELRAYVKRVARFSSKDTIPREVRRLVAERREELDWTWGDLENRSGASMREFTG